jgi:phenylalanyl-tRNA synthetase beta chain
VRVFEIGRCFLDDAAGAPVPGFRQPLRVAGLCAGSALPEQWGSAARAVDFFDAKADVEALLAPAGVRFEKLAHPALHPGRAASVLLDGLAIGVIGELHPRWVQKYELASGGGAPVVFELDMEALLARALPAYREISRFPAVTRDIALVVDQGQAVQPLLDTLQAAAANIVRRIDLFDVYQGKGLPEGKKSLAFRIVMQDTERTLEDGEVEAAVGQLISTAAQKFAASLRG